MKIEQFKDILTRLEQLYSAAGAGAPAKDVRAVARLLEGNEDKTMDEFIAETKALLNDPPRAKTKMSADQNCVAIHARRLLDAGTDQSAFQTALESLDADKGLGKTDWYAIANHYRNAPAGGTHVYKFNSVKAARAAIRDVFIERFEAESKRGVIDRIMHWAS